MEIAYSSGMQSAIQRIEEVRTSTNRTFLNLSGLSLTTEELGILIDGNEDVFLSLTELYLPNNRLTHLPGNLSSLTKLRVLNLSHNKLKNFELSNLTELEYLNLSQNQITHLHLSKLLRLERLDLHHNQLRELHLSDLLCLGRLDLHHNQLRELHLSDLQRLERLDLSEHEITGDLRLNLSGLLCLERLDLSRNGITGCSLNFSNSTKLRVFNLSRNQIGQLSPNLFNLHTLNYIFINIRHTQVTHIDPALLDQVSANPRLRLDLAGNALDTETIEAINNLPPDARRRITFDMSAHQARLAQGELSLEAAISRLLPNLTEDERELIAEMLNALNAADMQKLKSEFTDFLNKSLTSSLYASRKDICREVILYVIQKMPPKASLDNIVLQSWLEALGNCATPVSLVILNIYVKLMVEQGRNAESVILQLAIMNHIQINLKNELAGGDAQEKLQSIMKHIPKHAGNSKFKDSFRDFATLTNYNFNVIAGGDLDRKIQDTFLIPGTTEINDDLLQKILNEYKLNNFPELCNIENNTPITRGNALLAAGKICENQHFNKVAYDESGTPREDFIRILTGTKNENISKLADMLLEKGITNVNDFWARYSPKSQDLAGIYASPYAQEQLNSGTRAPQQATNPNGQQQASRVWEMQLEDGNSAPRSPRWCC